MRGCGDPICFGIALALLLCAGCEPAPKNPQETTLMVLAQSSWATDSAECPADFIPTKPLRPGMESCKGNDLPGCYLPCNDGDANSCYWLAHELQALHTRDSESAGEILYQRSCRLGMVSGCTNRAAGMLYGQPDSPDVHACTAKTFARTCELDDAWGCTMLALHLGRGMGVAVDQERALEVLKRSCTDGEDSEACKYGKGVRQMILDGAMKQGNATP